MDPFVERTGELRRLREWTAEVAATGVGRLVLVTGEAGAGKTRLCEELMGSVAGPDLAVAWSRCATFGQHLPLWPWPDVVRELAYQQGQERCEDQETPAHARDRYTLYQSVADRLRELCADRPAAVLIDDLHIAANESILLTQMVSGLLHRFPLLLVVTWRLDAAHFTEPSCPLASLAREASTIELLPFGCREVTEYLINTGHPRPGPEVVSRLLVQSGGNPMYLAELAQHDPSTAEDTHVVGMVRALARKVGRIDSAQRRFLGAVAVLGDGAALDEVAAVGGTSVQTVAATLDGMASGARVIDGRVHFSHELLRQAFLSALSDEEQLRFHVAAMEAVSGPAPERTVRRAGHAIAAATLSNEHREAAVLACLRAGQNLHTALAFESAASWAATGTRLADGSVAATTRAELLLLEAAASSSAGRLGDARGCYDRAVAPANEAADPRVLARAALGLGGVWVEEQRSELDRRRMIALCRKAQAQLPPDEELLAARIAVRVAAEQSDYGGETSAVEAAVDRVRRLQDPAATAEALSLYHHVLLGPDWASARLAVAEELLDAAVNADESIYSLFGLCWRTVDLYLLGDTGAERAFAGLRDRAAALSSQAVGYIVAVMEVMRAFRRGELAEADELAERARTLGLAAGDADTLGYYGGQVLALAWVRGDLGEMVPTIRDVLDSATLRMGDGSFAALLVYATAVSGDHKAARAVLDGMLAGGIDTLPRLSTWSTTMAVLIETAAVLGDATLADRLARMFGPFSQLPVMPSLAVMCLGPGQRLLGVAHATVGRMDTAIECFEAALIANCRLQSRPYDAIIRAELAAALVRRGRPEDVARARELFAQATAQGRALGLTKRVAQWESEAIGLRVHRGTPEPMTGRFVREGLFWRVEVGDLTAVVEPLVGLLHIAQLLAQPDTDIPAGELLAPGQLRLAPTRGEPTLDLAALRDYRNRLAELDELMDLADAAGDAERGRAAAQERDFILANLRRDTGLGGKARSVENETERSRIRVSKAIRRALCRLQQADATLGAMLGRRITTGLYCRYSTDPAQPISWTVRITPVALPRAMATSS